MFKLALDAGHGIGTAGKRCMKSLDPNETPEWWLNDRVCDYIAEYLRAYDGYELLRLDDFDDGQTDVGLAARTNKANAWGADFYLSIHHNAGVKGGKGGGIEAYSYSSSAGTGMLWRNDFYEAIIAETGLKGNRSEPKKAANFHVLRESKMPAALLELGFMDSATDVPVILSNEYAQKCARAIVAVIAKRAKLTRRPETAQTPSTMYKVQVGAFASQANAERLQAELQAKGYKSYIVRV